MQLNSKKIEKIVSLSDIHFPEQDDNAVQVALNLIKEEKPTYLILNGDIVDFYSISSFDRDPERKDSLQQEIDLAVHFFSELRKISSQMEIVYIQGNHEDRLRKFLWKNKEISNLRALEFDSLFCLDRLKIKSLSYGDSYILDDVIFTHGTKTTSGCGKPYMDTYAFSGVTGHTHRLNINYKTVYNKTLFWIESGCLCKLAPEYIKGLPDWQQGLVFGYKCSSGVKIRPVPIVDGNIFL